MTASNMQFSVDQQNISIQTQTGWSHKGKPCSIATSRGISIPQAKAAKKMQINHQLHTKRLSKNAVEFWQTIGNDGAETLNITGIQFIDGQLKLAGAGWRVAHHELFRRERYFESFTTSVGGFVEAVEKVHGQMGLSENWPFPGLFFTHPERGTVLMAVLSQEHSKPVWDIQQRDKKIFLTATERFTGIPAIGVAPGKTWSGERWVLIFSSLGMDDAIEQYYALLRKRISFYGEKSVLRKAVLWSSWNYNNRPRSFGDISHETIEANAKALSKLVKGKPHFVMIDDGYQRNRSKMKDMTEWFSSSLETFYDDGTPSHDPSLFPQGMKAMAQAIRKAGSRPAIWSTTRVLRESAFAKAHPDWILQLEDDRSFGKKSLFLDYSLPEVRQYTRNAWRTIFQEWGYEGLKLDFWSMPFEVPFVRYRNKDRTAVELRNLFLQDLREFVPKNGFVLVAVVCNTGGNPFVGKYVDATRMGMDIADGTYAEVQQSAKCVATASPFYRPDCLLGDPDSLGWCPKNTPGQNRVWATMTLLSGAICEIGGDLPNLPAEVLEFLQTAAKFHKPSRRASNDLFSGGIGNMPSNHLVLERDDGIYEAYLNWTNYPQAIELPRAVVDLWTQKRVGPKYLIPPHDVLWFKRGS